ncbi:MAG: FAD-binding oxidoreductase [Hyphomicrobiales bacterium]
MSNIPQKKLNHEVVVIGGGIIGLNIAFRLAKEGREVVVIDPGDSESRASFGNAGTISDYATVPVGTPNVLRNLPDLLFNRESPLSVRYGNFPSLLPWLIKFAYHCLPGPTETNAKAIGLLLNNSSDMWNEMASELGASKHFRRHGCLYLYESEKAFKASTYDERLRRENGVDVEVITAKEVLDLEPGLQPFKGGAHFFPNATSIDDPGKVMEIIEQNLRELGVLFLKTTATSISDNGSKIQVNCPDVTIDAAKVIIAAGAHSKALAASVGDHVPLDTERGYHIEYDLDVNPVSRPVCSAKRGFYASPMDGRLRIAGTVELGGLKLPPDPNRLKMLEHGARALFPHLGKPDRSWFGYRPSVPSSVPIIRKSKKNRNIILAFGHGHLGVTLAPITAKIVSRLISSNT